MARFLFPPTPELNDLPKEVQDGICFRTAFDRSLMYAVSRFPNTVELYVWISSLGALFGCVLVILEQEKWSDWALVGFVCLCVVSVGSARHELHKKYRQRVSRFRDEYLAGKFDAAAYVRRMTQGRRRQPRLPWKSRPPSFFYDPMPLYLVQLLG
ncbi:MAG: hypothetical protein ACPGVU_00245 [Limisphaerales bacterium]